MRTLVYGYYGFGNFGDDLLLRRLVDGIRERQPDATFCVHNLGPVPGFRDDGAVQFTGLARRLRNVRRRPWKMMFYLAAFCRRINDCDTLVIGGGTLFIDKGRINMSLVLLALAVSYARLRSRRVIVMGVAIDRMSNRISVWAMRRIFAAAEFIAVRDDPSLSYIAHVPRDKVHRTADLVFGLDLGPVPRAPARARPVLGLCFIDYYRTVEPSAARHEAYRAAILGLIERHRDRYDFALIVFQAGLGQRDDWLVPALREKFPDAAVHCVDSADAARRMAESVDVFLTTRFHLGVLGILWEKPVVVIDHELKMASLAEDFALPVIGMEDFLVRGNLDMDNLLQKYDAQKAAAARVLESRRAAGNFDWIST